MGLRHLAQTQRIGSARTQIHVTHTAVAGTLVRAAAGPAGARHVTARELVHELPQRAHHLGDAVGKERDPAGLCGTAGAQ